MLSVAKRSVVVLRSGPAQAKSDGGVSYQNCRLEKNLKLEQ